MQCCVVHCVVCSNAIEKTCCEDIAGCVSSNVGSTAVNCYWWTVSD